MRSLRTIIGVIAVCAVAGCSAQSAPAQSAAPAPSASRASAQDFAVNMQTCLAEAGWTVTVTVDGSYESEVPVEQADAFDEARLACESRFGYDLPPEPMEAEQVRPA